MPTWKRGWACSVQTRCLVCGSPLALWHTWGTTSPNLPFTETRYCESPLTHSVLNIYLGSCDAWWLGHFETIARLDRLDAQGQKLRRFVLFKRDHSFGPTPRLLSNLKYPEDFQFVPPCRSISISRTPSLEVGSLHNTYSISPMPDHSSTTRRCLGEVATVLIAQDGGRANIVAKTLATLWYILILPDAQARFHRQVYRKRLPWYAPSRVFGLMLSAANIATMPLSWVLLFAGKRNASRVACFSVLLNPPTITLSSLIVRELSSALVKRAYRIGVTSAEVLTKPFKGKESSSTKTSSTSAATTPSPTTGSANVTKPATPAVEAPQPEKNDKS